MTKEQILESTLELASEKGLGNISMSQIANRVGLKKSSLYSHFQSKDEIIEQMYIYFRNKAKQIQGVQNVEYDILFQGRTLEEVLTLVVQNYKAMNENPEMYKFYKFVMAERTLNPIAAEIMVMETKKMINATKQLFYALQVKGIANFENPDAAALSFAMSVHSIMDFENDTKAIGSSDADSIMKQYIHEFCSVYRKR